MTASSSIILLPGLGADHRLLEPQRRDFPGLIVPPWIPPGRRETLPDYALRLAKTIAPAQSIVLGGVSLGGMMAYEMARWLRPKALILVASCRSCHGVRGAFRRFSPFLSHLPSCFLRCTKPFSPLGSGILGGAGPMHKKLCVRMFQDADCRFMAWAIGAILKWRPEPLDGIPVFQIHGGRDRMLPVSLAKADEVLPEGGHLINLTHAEQVNRFIARVIATNVSLDEEQ